VLLTMVNQGSKYFNDFVLRFQIQLKFQLVTIG
jgi:hypothetical protein